MFCSTIYIPVWINFCSSGTDVDNMTWFPFYRGMMALETYNKPFTLMSIMASQSSKSPFWIGSKPCALPALLIRISIVENASGKKRCFLKRLSYHIKKVCTLSVLKVLFKFNHSVFTSAKDNFIIVFLLRFRRLLYRFR
jgi:hypothetical protein